MVGLMAANTYIIFIISLLFISINTSVNIINDASGFFHSGKSSDDFKLYENTKLKLSIQYPSTWQKEERLNDFVTFLSPIVDSSHYKSPAGLGISSLSVSNVSLNTIVNVHLKNMTNNLKDFQLIESSDTILADNRLAKKIIFTAMDDEEKKQALQLITKNNDKVYLITYKAYVDKYEQNFPIIQKMLNSLVFFK
ncbi:MAG TPA: PsbP-related protein [Nitrososphaeraceae archaeon]|nr:PsbP-related protein [Nitrososphaeraceae archaeon]